MENINFIVLFALGVIASGALGYLLSVARKHNSKLSKIDDLEKSFNFYQIQMERETENLERGIYQRIEELERNREEITRNITNEMYSQRKELQHDIGQLGDDVKMMVERRFDKVYAKVYQSEEDIHREIERIYQQIPNKKRKLGNLQKEY